MVAVTRWGSTDSGKERKGDEDRQGKARKHDGWNWAKKGGGVWLQMLATDEAYTRIYRIIGAGCESGGV